MPHYNFEPRIPLDHVMEIVGIVRSGDLVLRRAEVLRCAGSAIGEVGAYMEPSSPIGELPVSSEIAEMSIEECCEKLEQASNEAPESFGSVMSVVASPYVWALAKRVLILALQVL